MIIRCISGEGEEFYRNWFPMRENKELSGRGPWMNKIHHRFTRQQQIESFIEERTDGWGPETERRGSAVNLSGRLWQPSDRKHDICMPKEQQVQGGGHLRRVAGGKGDALHTYPV